MSVYHYEAGHVTAEQMHDVTDPSHGHGAAATIATVQRMLNGHGGSAIIPGHIERRAHILWLHFYGLLQGVESCHEYIWGKAGSLPALTHAPAGVDPGAKDVFLVDSRVAPHRLCPFLGIRFPNKESRVFSWEGHHVYWARLHIDSVKTNGKNLAQVLEPYQDTGMRMHELLAAIVQRVNLPDRFYAPWKDTEVVSREWCEPTNRLWYIIRYYREPRGQHLLGPVSEHEKKLDPEIFVGWVERYV